MIETVSIFVLVLSGVTLAITLANVIWWPLVSVAAANDAGAISVLIPARDEAGNITACLDAVLRSGTSIGEVIVYDDRSGDTTAELVRAQSGRDGRICLVEGSALPGGWCGKNFACASLADHARGAWLLFIDADARLTPGAADRLLAEARARHATMISAWPALVMSSFWERALMPMLNVVTFSLFPAPLSFLRNDASLGLVHGACILVERDAYRRVGGHTAVKGEIFEDQRLAHLWRLRGERGFCLDGRNVVSVRMYRSLGEIWRGFQKNFYPAFERELNFWGYLLLHGMVFVLPMILVVVAPSLLATATLAAALGVRILLAFRFRDPLWSVLLHPVAEAVLLGIAVASWWRCRSGRGVDWKGRRYLAGGGSGADLS